MTLQKLSDYRNQGYSEDQLAEIGEGLKHGIDVSKYADKDYFAIQMRQIRLGLEQGVDISLYAGKEFDWFQMEEIRLGLRDGLDARIYAKPEYSFEVMRQLRSALSDHIHLEKYASVGADLLKELHYAVLDQQNILPYIKEGYVPEQLSEIRKALKSGCGIDSYLNQAYRGPAIKEIRLGLEEGLDVSIYTNPDYSWHQMQEIRLGLEKRLDVSLYAKSLYSWQQMRELRLGLEDRLPVETYRSMVFSAADMQKKRLALLKERKEAEHAAQEILQRDETKRQALISEHLPKDTFRIMVDASGMEAYVFVGENAACFSKDTLRERLAQEGICMGIDEDVLQKLADGTAVRHLVTVARGKAPKNGRDGYYEYCIEDTLQREPTVLEDGSLNYDAVNWFENVSAGQKIAVYHEAEDGVDGYTLDGRILQGIRGTEQGPLIGRGFQILPDRNTYIASEDGCLLLQEPEMRVTKFLELETASMATGNISFDGSVHIKGDVLGNILIQASGDVVVDGFVESAVIECSGDIVLKKGANGNGIGRLCAARSVQGRFFENISVTAEKIVSNYFFRCSLYATGTIEACGSKGKNGCLSGGTVFARNSVTTRELGNKAGIITQVQLGLREKGELVSIQEELKECERQLLILANALNDYRKTYPPEERNMMKAFLKLENAVYTKNLDRKRLLQRIDLFEKQRQEARTAYLKVTGHLYEGTCVRINDAVFEGSTIERAVLHNSRHQMMVQRL